MSMEQIGGSSGQGTIALQKEVGDTGKVIDPK